MDGEYNINRNVTSPDCNATIDDNCYVERNPQLQQAYSIIVPVILIIIMLAMGAGITLQEVKDRLKPPTYTCIGLISVFILMPAVAFGLAHALRLQPNHAIGFLIVATCPGGTVSNIFTLLSRGDLPLSVILTAFSTVLAIGFMPLNLFIYLRGWTSDKAKIPFTAIAIIIALTWVPVIIGVAIRHKAPKAAPIITKVGSVMGLGITVIAVVMQNRLYPDVFSLPWKVWLAGVLLPLVGWGLGMVMGAIPRGDIMIMRTVAYENGMKNVGLALAIISLSFTGSERAQLTQFPLIYTMFQLGIGIVLVTIHRVVFAIVDKWKNREKYKFDKLNNTTKV